MADRPVRARLPGGVRSSAAVVAVVVLVAAVGILAGGHFSGADTTPVDNHTDNSTADPGPTVVDVAGASPVTVTYETRPGGTREFVVSDVDPALVDPVGEWAFVDSSALPSALERVAGRPAAGVVPVGRNVLVGNLTASTRRAGNVSVTIVAPASESIDPARKSYFLTEYLSPYSLGGNRSSVTLVAAPRALPHRGAMYADGTGYVTRRGFWDGTVGSVWLHEYLHAQQSFSLSPGMEWFREASAEYLAYRVMQEQYRNVTNDDVLARLDADRTFPAYALSNATGWKTDDVAYTRGVRLLYAVDAMVRQRSGGDSTLFDVFREMNGRDGAVSITEFRRIVERQSGGDAPWLRPAITGTGPMDRYRQYDGAVFRTAVSDDAEQ